MYVKVFGQFRVYKDERNVVGNKMNAVAKFDEVTNHFLQVFVGAQMRKKGVLTVIHSIV